MKTKTKVTKLIPLSQKEWDKKWDEIREKVLIEEGYTDDDLDDDETEDFINRATDDDMDELYILKTK